jgi:hypothetical protein
VTNESAPKEHRLTPVFRMENFRDSPMYLLFGTFLATQIWISSKDHDCARTRDSDHEIIRERGCPSMNARLVALDEGPDIMLNRALVVVGRHPQCDARLDSLRVSRQHCCMTEDHGDVVVRDLGSINGIRINGERVVAGRLRPGDELSIAQLRYRFESGQACEDSSPPSAEMAQAADGHPWLRLVGRN